MRHKGNAEMDWCVIDVLHYRPFECPCGLNSCISFHKGTTKSHPEYGKENVRCPQLINWDEDLECIYIECEC